MSGKIDKDSLWASAQWWPHHAGTPTLGTPTLGIPTRVSLLEVESPRGKLPRDWMEHQPSLTTLWILLDTKGEIPGDDITRLIQASSMKYLAFDNQNSIAYIHQSCVFDIYLAIYLYFFKTWEIAIPAWSMLICSSCWAPYLFYSHAY